MKTVESYHENSRILKMENKIAEVQNLFKYQGYSQRMTTAETFKSDDLKNEFDFSSKC